MLLCLMIIKGSKKEKKILKEYKGRDISGKEMFLCDKILS